MSRQSILILLGILTILAPFSGLPVAFRTVLIVLFGACTLGIGLSLRINREQSKEQAVEQPKELVV